MTRALAVVALLAASLAPAEAAPLREQSFTARTTSYCLPGTTRSGTPVRPGVVAVDPDWIPLGSSVQIEGLWRTYTAEDTGGGVRGPHIDIWQASCADALEWGVQYLDVSWWR